jgi:hypothetical protein
MIVRNAVEHARLFELGVGELIEWRKYFVGLIAFD